VHDRGVVDFQDGLPAEGLEHFRKDTAGGKVRVREGSTLR
jgi:hypothetical protein